MGTDIDGILGSSVGQPMATIFFNAFGQKGTLALWAFVVLVQYMMGSSMVRIILHGPALDRRGPPGPRCVSPVFRLLPRWRAPVLFLALPHEQFHRHSCQHRLLHL